MGGKKKFPLPLPLSPPFSFLRFIRQPLTLPVHALTMIGGPDAEEAMAATEDRLLFLTRERCCEGAVGDFDANFATAELLVLVLAVAAGAWLQQPRGRRISHVESDARVRERRRESNSWDSSLLCVVPAVLSTFGACQSLRGKKSDFSKKTSTSTSSLTSSPEIDQASGAG